MNFMQRFKTKEGIQPADAPARGGFLGLSRRGLVFAIIGIAAVGFLAWQLLSGPSLPKGFAGGNGRLEANEIYVSTKYPGRIREVLVNEGDTVQAGQIVARMDTSELEARLRQAEAQIREAEESRRVSLAEVESRRSEVSSRSAVVAARRADATYASQQAQRSRGLVPTGAVSEQEAQLDSSRALATRADVAGSQAQLAAARQELAGSQALAGRTESTIIAARAEADRIRAEIRDAVLISPIRARVESRLAEPGEVLAAGGRVFSLVDLSDVYMYVFLPEQVTGRIALGSEARIVLDAAPQYPITAYVSYVSPTAQFTPKTVETQEERHNLTFRVKLQIPRERLARYEPLVKVGIPGMGYVRYDNGAVWPARLQSVANPPTNLWQPTGRQGQR